MKVVAIVAVVMAAAGVAIGFPELTRAREAAKRAAARRRFIEVGRTMPVTLAADMTVFAEAIAAARRTAEEAFNPTRLAALFDGWVSQTVETIRDGLPDEGHGVTLEDLLGDGLPDPAPLIGRLDRAEAVIDRALRPDGYHCATCAPRPAALRMNRATLENLTAGLNSAPYSSSSVLGAPLGRLDGLPIHLDERLPTGVVLPVDAHGQAFQRRER